MIKLIDFEDLAKKEQEFSPRGFNDWTLVKIVEMLNRIATHLNKQEADTDEIIKSLNDDTEIFNVLKQQSKKDDSESEVKSPKKCPCSMGGCQSFMEVELQYISQVEAKDKEIKEIKEKQEHIILMCENFLNGQ